MLAITATAVNGVVQFLGDGQPDVLDLFVENGVLKYTGATPAAAVLNVNVAAITELNIDLGGGSDSVQFGGLAPFALNNGRLAVTNTELIGINQSINTGGSQQYFGVENTTIEIGVPTVTLSAGQAILFEAAINAVPMPAASTVMSPVAPPNGHDFLAWQRSLGAPSAASRATGDMDGDHDVDATDLQAWRNGIADAAEQAAEAQAASAHASNGNNFVTWQRGLGSSSPSALANADFDGDGDADRFDLDVWRQDFAAPAVAEVQGMPELTVASNTTVTFKNDIGLDSPLGSLTVTAMAGIVISRVQPAQPVQPPLPLRMMLDGNSTTFNNPVVLMSDLVIDDTGDVTFNDTVDGDGNGPWDLTVNTGLGGSTVFNGLVGNMFALGDLTTNADGRTIVNTSQVMTTGNQTYNDRVELTTIAASTTLTANNVLFASTVDGAVDLTIDTAAAGVAEFRGPVGDNQELNSLSTDADGQTLVNAPRISTIGNQDYNGPVTLAMDVVVTSDAGNVTFFKTVNGSAPGAQSLEVRTPQVTTFRGIVGGNVALESLATDNGGQTRLSILPAGASVLTAGPQFYGDAVTLDQNTILQSQSGDVTFLSTVDAAAAGGQSLEVRTPQAATFNDVVGGAFALASLATNGVGGQTKFNIAASGVDVRTTGRQTYDHAVVLMKDTILQSNSENVIFLRTVDGTTAGTELLEVRSTQLTQFNGFVGRGVALESLATDDGGTTELAVTGAGRHVVTQFGQSYNDVVVLNQDTRLTSLAGSVTFARAVNALAAGAQSLDVESPQLTSFNDDVGGLRALGSLTTDLAGQTKLNKAAGVVQVLANGLIRFNDPLVLMRDAVLQSLNGNIEFGNTVNGTIPGMESLELFATQMYVFEGAVGGAIALESLITRSPGQTKLNVASTGVDVRVNGDIDFQGPVVLMQDTIVESLAGNVSFASTVNGTSPGTESLEVLSPQLTTFSGVVGGGTALESLTTDALGRTRVNVNGNPATVDVRTVGHQTYNDAVTLMMHTVLQSTGGNVTFALTVDGATPGGEMLEVQSPQMTTFSGVVGGNFALRSLTTDIGGQTKLNIVPSGIDVRTELDQLYGDALVLMQDAILASNAGSVTFGGAINGTTSGAELLDIRAPLMTVFQGVVGGSIPLERITTDQFGQTKFDVAATGVDVRTIFDQVYNDEVVIMEHTSLEGRDVAFARTVDGDGAGPWDLLVNAHRTATFSGNVGVANRLRNLVVRTGGQFTGPFTIGVRVEVTQGIDIQVRESDAASVADDLTLLSTAQFVAGGNVQLGAGDDISIFSGATINAGGTLTIEGDFGDNDPNPTTIVTTTATPTVTDAVGMLRGVAGIIIRGGDDQPDVINLQADRLSTPASVVVQGYSNAPTASGNDQFLLVFSSNFMLTVGSLQIEAGDDVAGRNSDFLTLEHSKDTLDRKVQALYRTAYDGGTNTVINGSDTDFRGFGTVLGFSVRDMENYVLNGGSGVHDHFFVQANNQVIPNSPNGDFRRLEQEIVVADNPVVPAQWHIFNYESGQLVGSNVRDVISNNTTLPMLIEGREGNDTLIGGSTVDVIFSGPGVTLTALGEPIFFNVGAPDRLLIPVAPVRAGDTLVGADGNDFLFADVDLFRDGSLLWGLVTLDVPGESELIEGAGQNTAPIQQTNHGAQFGANDMIRNITGMLIDGGGVKDVMTWLRATPMRANLTAQFTSTTLNMLIDNAFNANLPQIGKVGILQPPYNVQFNDLIIRQRVFPTTPQPVVAAIHAPSSTSNGKSASLPSDNEDDSLDGLDQAFAILGA